VTSGLIPECVTEVYCSTTDSFGSGYLLGPGLVLTACHVIDDTGNDLPNPIKIQVRPLLDAEPGGVWREASLAWPRTSDWRQWFTKDIALLQFTPDDQTKAVAQRPPLGWGGLPRDQPVTVRAIGFPKFRRRPDGTRDTQPVSGEIEEGAAKKAQEWALLYKGRQPREEDDWKGISGAALFAEGRLVGIISRKVPGESDFRPGMEDFKGVRLEPALQDEGFNALIGAEPVVSDPIRTMSDLPALVCLVDRDPQETPFRNTLGRLLALRPTRPLLCLITGKREHCADELINRFALQTVPVLYKKPKDPVEFRPIAWPAYIDDPAAELRNLREMLWSHIAEPGELPPADNDDRAFCRRLSEPGLPHLFQSEISPDALGPEQAQLFAEWLAFLDRLAALGLDRPPVHAILIKEISEKRAKEWLAQIRVPARLDLHPLRELMACVWGDFGEWHRRVHIYRPPLGAEIDRLRDDIEVALGGQTEFTVEALKKALRSAIHLQRAANANV